MTTGISVINKALWEELDTNQGWVWGGEGRGEESSQSWGRLSKLCEMGAGEWGWDWPPAVWLQTQILPVLPCWCIPAFFLHWETFYGTYLLRSWYVQLDKKVFYTEWKRKRKVFLVLLLRFCTWAYLWHGSRPLSFLLTSYHGFFCLNTFLNFITFFSIFFLLCELFYYWLYFPCYIFPVLTLRCLQCYYRCSVCISLL